MPNKSKLYPELFKQLIQLATDGYNHTEIAKKLNQKRQTVDYWLRKYKIACNSRRTKDGLDKVLLFKEACEKALLNKTTIKLNQSIKEIGIYARTAYAIISQNPQYEQLIRSKKQAISEDKQIPIEEVQKRLPDQKDKIIGIENKKHKIITEDGFIYFKTLGKLYQGDPRNKCGSRLALSKVIEDLANHGYDLIQDTWTIKRNPCKAIHLKCGQIREARFINFFQQKCATCSNNGVSKQETEVREFIESLGLKTEKFKFKGVTRGKELDIYIPSKQFAIEYNGLHWHSEEYKDKKYHQNKMKMAETEGIRLINIFEDEWLERSGQIKSFLRAALGVCENRIYARDCIVKEVNSEEANSFLNQYHIQGKAFIKTSFGLYYQDQLIGVITGNNHHRKSNEKVFVLSRLVFKENFYIVGGSSRLLKKLLEYCRSGQYTKLVSWSDNRYSQGNVYKALGFALDGELTPDYSYLVGQSKRQSKQSNKKSSLLKKGAVGNTENEMAISLGYKRIWDCGKKRWIIEIIK